MNRRILSLAAPRPCLVNASRRSSTLSNTMRGPSGAGLRGRGRRAEVVEGGKAVWTCPTWSIHDCSRLRRGTDTRLRKVCRKCVRTVLRGSIPSLLVVSTDYRRPELFFIWRRPGRLGSGAEHAGRIQVGPCRTCLPSQSGCCKRVQGWPMTISTFSTGSGQRSSCQRKRWRRRREREARVWQESLHGRAIEICDKQEMADVWIAKCMR